MSMPEGHAILGGGAAVAGIGEVAAAPTAQAIAAACDGQILVLENKTPKLIVGGDGNPIEASFAVSLPVTIRENSHG